MRMKPIASAAAACALLAAPAAAGEPASKKPDETVTPKFFHAIPNIPGKSVLAVQVTYPPGGKSPPHRHAKSAFIYAYVLSGSIRSQVEGQPVHVYKAGESFFENPNSHHLISESASQSEPASLLAVFVVDTDDKAYTTFDK